MRLYLLSLLLLLSLLSEEASFAQEEVPWAEIPGTGTWLPNSALRPPDYHCCDVRGWPAYQDAERRWLFAVTGGLARFDPVAGSFSFFPVTPAATLSGIARVGTAVWLSAFERLIHRFEPGSASAHGQSSFLSPVTIGKTGTPYSGGNLEIVQDPFSGDVWTKHVGHLDVYDARAGQWRSLDAVFSEKNLGEPNVHSILFENDAVWVADSAHSKARGGLLRLRRGLSGGWSLYRKELVGGTVDPERLDSLDLYADDQHLWVFFYIDNSYNFTVAVFDKANESWRSYQREQAIPELARLADAVPGLRWAGRASLAVRLSELARNAPMLPADHPYRLPRQALVSFKEVVAKLQLAFASRGLLNQPSPGLSDYVVRDGKITADRRSNGPCTALPLKEIYYTCLLHAASAEDILAATPDGLVRIDLKSHRLRPLSPTGRASTLESGVAVAVTPFAGGQKLMLYEVPIGDDPTPSLRIIDLTKNVITPLTMPGGKAGTSPQDVGSVAEQFAVRTAGGAVLVYDIGSGAWRRTAAGASFRPTHLRTDELKDQQFLLPDGSRMERRANGIWHIHK